MAAGVPAKIKGRPPRPYNVARAGKVALASGKGPPKPLRAADYYNVPSLAGISGQTAGSGGGGGFGLGNIGHDLLNALSVPGAVTLAGATLLEQKLQDLGNDLGPLNYTLGKGVVKTHTPPDARVKWSDLLGTFRGDYRGGYKFLRSGGHSKATSERFGIAPEVIIDPLWLVGGGIGGAARASKLKELAGIGDEVRKILGPKATKAFLGGKKIEELGVHIPDESQLAKLHDAGLRANKVRLELDTMGGVPELRIGLGKNKARIPLPSVKLSRLPQAEGLKNFGIETRFMKSWHRASAGRLVRTSPLERFVTRGERMTAHMRSVVNATQEHMLRTMGLGDKEIAQLFSVQQVAERDAYAAGKLVRDMKNAGEWGDAQDTGLAFLRRYARTIPGIAPSPTSAAATFERHAQGLANTVAGFLTEHQTALAGIDAKVARSRRSPRPLLRARKEYQAALDASATRMDEVVRLAAEAAGGEAPKRVVSAAAAAHRKRVRILASTLGEDVQKLESEHNAVRLLADDAARADKAGLKASLDGRIKDAIATMRASFVTEARQSGVHEYFHIPAQGAAGVPTLDEFEQMAAKLSRMGASAPRSVSPETWDALRRWRSVDYEQLYDQNYLREALHARDIPDFLNKEEFPSIAAWHTKNRFVENMMKAGVPKEWAERAAAVSEKVGGTFADKEHAWPQTDVVIGPDFNLFRAAGHEAEARMVQNLRAMTEDLVRQAFPDERMADGMIKDLLARYHTRELPYSIHRVLGTVKHGAAAGELRFPLYTAWLKQWFTNFNLVSHYNLNAVGNWINSLVEGNKFHFTRGFLGAFGIKMRPLAKFDQKALDRSYKISKDASLTGMELMLMSSVSGLGTPYTLGEIESVVHTIQDTRLPIRRWLAKHLNRLQMNRENADRLYQFYNNLRGGDDIFTAGSKVVRAVFDYHDLTTFEKIWLRNLLLFYTWFRKNLTFQGYGMITRPGMYDLMNRFEHHRPKYPGEPDWWKKAGGIWSPWGLLTFGNPMADVFKWELSWDNVQRNVIGMMTPFLMVPASLAANKNLFTGGDIEKYPGEVVPSPFGAFGPWRGARHPGEQPTFGLPARAAFGLRAFSGPLGALAEDVATPKKGFGGPIELAGRVSGAKFQPVVPEEFARRAASIAKTKRAAKTRARNVGRQGPLGP